MGGQGSLVARSGEPSGARRSGPLAGRECEPAVDRAGVGVDRAHREGGARAIPQERPQRRGGARRDVGPGDAAGADEHDGTGRRAAAPEPAPAEPPRQARRRHRGSSAGRRAGEGHDGSRGTGYGQATRKNRGPCPRTSTARPCLTRRGPLAGAGCGGRLPPPWSSWPPPPSCCATWSSGRSTSGRSTSRSTARPGSRCSPGRPVYSAMTEAAAAAAVHLPPVRSGAGHPAGVAAVRGRRLAVDRAADRGQRRDRLVRRLAPDPPHRRVGADRPRPADRPRCCGCTRSRDGIRFGQVNAFMVLACLMDLRRATSRAAPTGATRGARRARDVDQAHPRRLRRALPRQPPVARGRDRRRHGRGRHAGHVGAAAAGVVRVLGRRPAGPQPGSGRTWAPRTSSCAASCCAWGRTGSPGTALWLACVAVVGVFGFWLARRAYLAGDSISEVAAVGLMAVPAVARGVDPPPALDGRGGLRLLGADPLRDRRRLLGRRRR